MKGGGLLKKAFGNALRRKSLPQAWRLFDEARQSGHADRGMAQQLVEFALRHNKLSKAWQMYGQAERSGLASTYLATRVVDRSTGAAHAPRVAAVWDAIRGGDGAPELDAHLCSSLIKSFGARGEWARANDVLQRARRDGHANAYVFNAALMAAAVPPPRRSRAAAAAAAADDPAVAATLAPRRAARVLRLMEADGVAADGHTAALEIAVHGNAGRLDAAEAALDRAVARGDADAVVHNAYVGAAAKVADAEAALAALRRHPAPDITSYNSALAAIAQDAPRWLRPHRRGDARFDRIDLAQSLEAEIAERGLAADDTTRTTLLAIYGDSPIGEALVDGAGAGAGASGAAAAAALPVSAVAAVAGAELETDLRGLTRPAASILLQRELARQLQFVLDGEGGEERPGGGGVGGGGGGGGGWTIITKPKGALEMTALHFLVSQAVAYTAVETGGGAGDENRGRGGRAAAEPAARLRVDASELRRAAFEVERRRVTRSVAARVCLVASVVSGFVIVPELLAATSI